MWSLLSAAVPSLIKGVMHGKNKPKKSDYKPNTEGMQKYVSYLKGKRSTNQVMDQAMRPALRTIGEAGRRQQQEIGYGAARSGLAGSGIEAAQRQQASQAQMQQLQDVGAEATAAQMAADRDTEGKVQQTYSQMDQERKRAEDAYKSALKNHKAQMDQIWTEGLTNVAQAGLGMAQASQLAKNKRISDHSDAMELERRAEAHAEEFGTANTKGTYQPPGPDIGPPMPPVDQSQYDYYKSQGYSDQDIIDRFQDVLKQRTKYQEKMGQLDLSGYDDDFLQYMVNQLQKDDK
tara:strand:+ start:1241 stop:2110 length:870 start_codon:yes stop_codon:yes gene_type:complete